MSVSVTLFSDEIKFLESTAQSVLKDNFPDGWWIGDNAFAELDISQATREQKKILLRRLGGYKPILAKGKLLINLNEILDF